MYKKPFFLIFGVCALLSYKAFAANDKSILLKVDDGSGKIRQIEVPVKEGKAEQWMDLSEKPISIDLKNYGQVLSIKKRSVSAWAVGEEGPWTNLDGMEEFGPWIDIAVKKSSLILLAPYVEKEQRAMSKQEYDAAYKKLETSPDAARWLPVMKRCQGTTTGSPCYSYHSADEFLFTLPNKSEIILTIAYPGGC